MKLEVGRQFYQLVVVAWLAFSLESVQLTMFAWHDLNAQMIADQQLVTVRDGLNGIIKSLLDLESRERGYVITGNKQFLEPFNQAETNLPTQFNQLVAQVQHDAATLEFVTELRTEAEASLSWQHDILDLSKIESGGLQLHPDPTDLRKLCDFLHTLFAEPAAKKGLKLEGHAAADLPHALLLDRIRLRQILSNLVGKNARNERFNGYMRKPFSKRELFEELADFLPRHSKSELPDESAAASQTQLAATAAPPARNELISHLRPLMMQPWAALRDSVAVHESKEFAQGVEGLGKRWPCEPLVGHAQTQLRDAENCAVTDLEKHLGEFPVLVEQLDPQA